MRPYEILSAKMKMSRSGKKNVILDQNKEAEIYIFTSKLMVENWNLGKLYQLCSWLSQKFFLFHDVYTAHFLGPHFTRQ